MRSWQPTSMPHNDDLDNGPADKPSTDHNITPSDDPASADDDTPQTDDDTPQTDAPDDDNFDPVATTADDGATVDRSTCGSAAIGESAAATSP